jgi:hypothetical protein
MVYAKKKQSLNNNMYIELNWIRLVKCTFNICLNTLTAENSVRESGNLFHKVTALILTFLRSKEEWQLYGCTYRSCLFYTIIIIDLIIKYKIIISHVSEMQVAATLDVTEIHVFHVPTGKDSDTIVSNEIVTASRPTVNNWIVTISTVIMV